MFLFVVTDAFSSFLTIILHPPQVEAMTNIFNIESAGTPPSQSPVRFTEAPASPVESVYVAESPHLEWGSPLATSPPTDIIVPESPCVPKTPVAPVKTASHRAYHESDFESDLRRFYHKYHWSSDSSDSSEKDSDLESIYADSSHYDAWY